MGIIHSLGCLWKVTEEAAGKHDRRKAAGLTGRKGACYNRDDICPDVYYHYSSVGMYTKG